MGVGFGETSSSVNGQPDTLSNGWIMQSSAISVGLTTANILQFAVAGLDSLRSSGDGFSRGRASVSVNGGPALPGSVLVDGGVHDAMLQPALSATPATVNGSTTTASCSLAGITCTAPGNSIAIALGGSSRPRRGLQREHRCQSQPIRHTCRGRRA